MMLMHQGVKATKEVLEAGLNENGRMVLPTRP